MDQAKTNLNIMDLSSILQSLSGAKRSGTLRVRRDEGEKSVYFRDGSIEAVAAPRKRLKLGEALMKYGSITEEELQKALQKQKELRIDLGGALLKLGLVEEEEIRKALVFQLTEEVCELFAWENIHCEFSAGEPPESIARLSREGVAVSVNPESVVMEAARRIDEWEMLKKSLSSMRDVYAATPRAIHYYEEESGSEAECEVLSYIDGVRDVEEVVDKARMSKFDVLKTFHKLIEAKEVAPIEPVHLMQLAFNCASQGQLKKCIKLYERAEEMGVTGFDLNMRLAKTYEALGMGDKAVQRYAAHAKQAFEAGKLDEAVETYQKVVSLNKWELDSHEKLIDVLLAQKRREEVFKHAVRLAQKLLERKEEDRAISLWQMLKEALPDSTKPYRSLADLHIKARRTVQAIIELENLAGLDLVNNRTKEAIETFREMLGLDNECVQARLSLASTLAEIGETGEAVKEYTALAEMLSSSGVIQESSNQAFLVDVYEKIVSLEAENVSARQWLANAYADNDQVDKAVHSLRQIAEIRRAEGRLTDIVEPLTRIVELQPDDENIRMELGKVYFELGDITHATEAYQYIINKAREKQEFGLVRRAAEKVLKVDPYNVVAHRALADVYENVGEEEKQIAELQIVGWLSYCGGHYLEAADAFEAVLKIEPDSMQIALTLPYAYELLGEDKKAFQRYLSLAREAFKRNDLGIARWAGEKASRIDGRSDRVRRILEEVGEKETALKKGSKSPVIERPRQARRAQPVIEGKRTKGMEKG